MSKRRRKANNDVPENPPHVAEDIPAPAKGGALRTRLIAGVVTLIPIIVTLLVVFFISDKLQTLFEPVTTRILKGVQFPEDIGPFKKVETAVSLFLSLILAVLTIYVVGLFSSNIAIKRLIGLGERILEGIPVIKTVYGTMKQIAETFSLQNGEEFQKVVVLEYPRRGIYALAFVTGESRMEGDTRLFVNVFVPTTPNPTSGFLLILPSDDLREIELTYEEAFKFIISGGLLELGRFKLSPYRPKAPQRISRSAKQKQGEPQE